MEGHYQILGGNTIINEMALKALLVTWGILGRTYGMTAEELANSSLTQKPVGVVICSLPLLQGICPFEGFIFGESQQSVPSIIGFTPH